MSNVSEYKCFADWIVDGKTVCHKGGIYKVRPAAGEDEEGYCDVIGCDDGSTLETNFIDIGEHLEPANA